MFLFSDEHFPVLPAGIEAKSVARLRGRGEQIGRLGDIGLQDPPREFKTCLQLRCFCQPDAGRFRQIIHAAGGKSGKPVIVTGDQLADVADGALPRMPTRR